MSSFEALQKVISNMNFTGAALVQQGHEVIIKNGYGKANRSDRIPNSADTRFGIASGCKIFTSVAICQLAEEGRLTFDTRLKDLLTIPFPHFSDDITVHHLLTHTSGIPDYFDESETDDFEDIWKDRPMYRMQSASDFLPLFQHEKMKFEPGAEFSYNNSGFILLGLIVEELTGMSFTDYVEDHIFKPAGMTDSGYFRMDQLPERTALGYIDDEDHWKTNIYSLPIKGGPDGGAFTTVNDLKKFWDSLFNDEILREDFRKILLTPHVLNQNNIYYGYGVWISMKEEEILKYFVMGFDPGVRMHSSVNMVTKVQTHVLSNTEESIYPFVKMLDESF
ncbi:serine hydrolase domain-containing protein [Jeotgalibacillus terrae]|uniref:Serine hydrolase domain-containing protein n=1 Tax=Jeotgalibacillus terrae TaxID=587735 RepID=A0ABW5ZN01_9BACL|nr:serine hydrolase [Jeotgalibacillus terrae]MBM7578156.1 CubicO group peptidase (beta-lactamase class C family) [Jeotgalibacillus terrae]